MSENFPQWWSEPDGKPRQFHEGDLIPEGWVRRHGSYDVQIGQWVADPEPKSDPFDHDGDGKPGGSKPMKKKAK